MGHRLELPVAVIGAGPIGLAAAARLHERGLPSVIFEAGDEVGRNIRDWGHVRMFSPWLFNIDRAAGRLLAEHGWEHPDRAGHPTGDEFVDRYLAPLAALPELKPRLRLGARVTTVTRDGVDKLTGDRNRPFVLTVWRDGSEERLAARAVIDASGTWGSPNPLGADGVPAPGEHSAAARINYGIPDVLGAARARHAGRTTAVVGGGHSAQNAVRDLAQLARMEPDTRVVWAIRAADQERVFGPRADAQLPERGRLGSDARALVESGAVQLVTGFRTTRVDRVGDRLRLRATDRTLEDVDAVIAATGFRPDLSLLRELRLDLDPVVESPRALAPLVDPNLHDCGTVLPHGAVELAHPEPDLYVVGAKSYGRAPTFLTMTGYEQIRSVVAAIADEDEAARGGRLDMPRVGTVLDTTHNPAGSACRPAASDGPGPASSCDGAGQGAVDAAARGCCG